MAATSQFTPQQILDAARRAEQGNNVAYAVQFYRHLADLHPQTAESLAAREALTRLSAAQGQTQRPSLSAPRHGVESGAFAQQHPTAPSPPAPPVAGHHATPTHPANHTGGRVIPMQAARPTPPQHSQAAARPHLAVEHPHPPRQARVTPRRRYKLGRALSTLLGMAGWIAAIAAVAALIVPALLATGTIKSVPSYVTIVSIPVSMAALASGLLLILMSQIARATFDSAEATRHGPSADE